MGKRKENIQKTEQIEQTKVSEDGTDGKFTMVKNGKGKRFHKDRIEEMKEEGWKLV